MKELQTDILIVGGGLTGLMTAFVLSALKKDIIIIDRHDFRLKKDNVDFRTTAISEGSKEFFKKMQIWSPLEESAEKIEYIHVQDRSVTRNIKFKNFDSKGLLGYIVENKIIKKTLIKKLIDKKNVRFISNQNFISVDSNSIFTKISFNDYRIKSSLLIAADGKNSSIRSYLKIPIYKKEYPHKAVVINFNHTKNHKNSAYELFYKTGPLAILPMKKKHKNLYSSSVIWSNENNYISSFKKIDKKKQKFILQEKISTIVGDIIDIKNIQTFDLSAHINFRFNDKRILFIGDSAHSIHPIAGQGWNLGVRDIRKCFESLEEAQDLGLDIGSSVVLNKYNDLCYYDAFSLYQITDKLNSIFINDGFFANTIRSFGFNLIEKNNNIKKLISNYAMGIN